MATISFNKLLKSNISAGDNKSFIYLQIKWEDEEFEIKMLDSETSKCYQGVAKAAAMKEIASNLDMSYGDYYECIRAALCTYISLPGFYYKLEPEMKVLNVWKSEPESIPILFLDIDVKEVRSSNEILDSAIELLQQQKKSLTNQVQKAHKFDEHSRELLEDYKLCVEEKNNLEQKLLKKVAVILNAKKDRIAQLEDRLKRYEDVDDKILEDNPHISKTKRHVISESEDDEYMADTQPLSIPNK